MSRSYCHCNKLTPGYPGSRARVMGWFERLLLLLIPHFDIIKEIDGPTTACSLEPHPNGPCEKCRKTKHTVVYLRRFYLWRSSWIGKNWGDLYLHKIYRSDDDPDPHSHPWNFRTFVLWGGYVDEGYDWDGDWAGGQRFKTEDEVVKAPATRYRDRWHIHRVILLNDQPAWTLVWTTGYTRDARGDAEWYFVKEKDLVPWRKYLGLDQGEEHGG